MKWIRDFFWKYFFIGKNFRELNERVRILEHQYHHLLTQSNKHVRRRWKRMLTNPKSPFYIGTEGR